MRTNICLQSEDLSVTWGNILSVDAQSQGVAPDGKNTANKLTDDSSTGTGGAQIRQAITIDDSTQHTLSAHLKADQLNWARLLVTLAGNSPAVYFDLNNGVVGTETGTVDSSSIIDIGDSWYRCIMTYTTTTESGSPLHRIYLADADTDAIVDLDGTSSIFVWGAQLETGDFASPYIPTTTESVSRAEDPFIAPSIITRRSR